MMLEEQKRDRSGRRITSRARRRELVAAYRASGLTMAQFSKREGINWQTVAKWSTLERDAVAAALKFAEVKLPLLGAVARIDSRAITS